MARRPGKKSGTALDHSKESLARQESELRDRMAKLERMIEEAPRVAEELGRQQREELLSRATEGRSRLDVAMSLQDTRYGLPGGSGRRRALRKERREGRIIFIVLLIALAGAVVWLVSHLPHF